MLRRKVGTHIRRYVVVLKAAGRKGNNLEWMRYWDGRRTVFKLLEYRIHEI